MTRLSVLLLLAVVEQIARQQLQMRMVNPGITQYVSAPQGAGKQEARP